jgi:hypothetical protein
MKLVCTKCHTVYSVAEQKVFGGELQRLCKHCGEPIAIPEEQESQPSAGNASADNSGFINIRAVLESCNYSDKTAAQTEVEEPSRSTTGPQTWTDTSATLGSPKLLNWMFEKGKIDKSVILALCGAVAVLSAATVAMALILQSGEQLQSVAKAALVAPAIGKKPATQPPTTQPTEPKSGLKREEVRRAIESLSKSDQAAGEAPKKAVKRDNPPIRLRELKNSNPGSRSVDLPRNTPKRAVASALKAQNSAPSKSKESKVQKSAASKNKESIDDILALAVQGKAKKEQKEQTPSAAAPSSKLPAKPSREDVLRALRTVQPAVKKCARGKGQVATADITVASTGRVKSVRMNSVSAPVASCMAREVQKARFPKFSSPIFSVRFPFQL